MYYSKALSYDHTAIDFDIISHDALKSLKKRRTLSFYRIYKAAGIRRVSSRVSEITDSLLRSYLCKILSKSLTIMTGDRKKTVSLIHILYALK